MSSSFIEGKDCLGESFVDPKDELISTTSHGTLQKEFATDPPDELTKLWRSIGNFLIGKGKTQIWMVQSLTLSFLDKMDCYMGERLNMIFGTPIGKLISI